LISTHIAIRSCAVWDENESHSTSDCSSISSGRMIARDAVDAQSRGLRWRCIEQLGRELLCRGRSRHYGPPVEEPAGRAGGRN